MDLTRPCAINGTRVSNRDFTFRLPESIVSADESSVVIHTRTKFPATMQSSNTMTPMPDSVYFTMGQSLLDELADHLTTTDCQPVDSQRLAAATAKSHIDSFLNPTAGRPENRDSERNWERQTWRRMELDQEDSTQWSLYIPGQAGVETFLKVPVHIGAPLSSQSDFSAPPDIAARTDNPTWPQSPINIHPLNIHPLTEETEDHSRIPIDYGSRHTTTRRPTIRFFEDPDTSGWNPHGLSVQTTPLPVVVPNRFRLTLETDLARSQIQSQEGNVPLRLGDSNTDAGVQRYSFLPSSGREHGNTSGAEERGRQRGVDSASRTRPSVLLRSLDEFVNRIRRRRRSEPGRG